MACTKSEHGVIEGLARDHGVRLPGRGRRGARANQAALRGVGRPEVPPAQVSAQPLQQASGGDVRSEQQVSGSRAPSRAARDRARTPSTTHLSQAWRHRAGR